MLLKAGAIGNLNDSMTQAMEDAFREVWEKHFKTDFPEAGEVERHLLFSAIAKGVLKHLKDHLGKSLKITVSVTQNMAGDQDRIISQNTKNTIPVTYSVSGYIETNKAVVTQVSDPVISRGEATVVEVNVEDLP